MSSRALRRLQRDQAQQRLASLQDHENEEDMSEGDESSPERPVKKINAFDILEGANEDEEDEDEGEADMNANDTAYAVNRVEQTLDDEPKVQPKSTKSKKKKKKSKRKGTNRSGAGSSSAHTGRLPADPEMDEIDRALRELSTKLPAKASAEGAGIGSDAPSAMWHKETSKLLSVDSKNLNPLTEMKSLFGHVALESQNAAVSRPRGRGEVEHVDLGTALMGRYSPASKGQEFGALASRRNIFMHAKSEWPRTASGGLGMELKGENGTGEKTYQIVHNAAYATTQHHFQLAVEMMQPERMIQLLQYHPYHVATLLQVSEIAKHQGDHAVAADLLERALFTFGRSVHSTFGVSLREGLARLEFDVPENRELWLTIWRYISNLGMRGTWRTAFEWAKVLLSLNPLKDPYSVTLFIDQLALRGRQQEQLIELCREDAFGRTWSHLPNVQISLALAYHRTSNPSKARQVLAEAIYKYPYIIHRLFQELDLTPIPKSIWGSLPSTDAEKLYTELYATRAKDLWNTPETTTLLMEVAQSVDSYDLSDGEPAPKLEISLEEARHVLLTEVPPLIALLPRRFTNMTSSASDPLPPPDSVGSEGFTPRAPGQVQIPSPTEAIRSAANAGAGWFTRLMEWFQGPAQALDEDNLGEAFQEALAVHGDEIPPQLLEAFRNDAMTGGDRREIQDNQDDAQPEDTPDLINRQVQPSSDAPDVERNPRSATVEDDESDGEMTGRSTINLATDRALLRSRSPSPETRPSATERPEPATPEPGPAVTTHLSKALLNDPQRTQRWLLSSGAEPLQSFVKDHGTDPSKWPAGDFPLRAVNEYYTAMMTLRSTQRDWIINVLGQRDKAFAQIVRDEVIGRPRQIVDVP